VVSTACYIARKYGVRSAMPMFQARKLCPQAVILKPRHAHYSQVARQIRVMMQDLTPLVEPLSLDEAYLDLSGTERIHHQSPAKTMAALALRIEREIQITVSIGLSGNKFRQRPAALDKPRGFAVIGMAEAKSFPRDKKSIMRGAGKVTAGRLERDGITTIGQLQDADPKQLARYGATGLWLHRMANAQDSRRVDPSGEMKTISSGNHLQQGPVVLCRAGKHIVAPGRAGQRPCQSQGPGRAYRGSEAQDRGFPPQNPQRFAGGAHPACRPHLPHRAGCPEAGSRRHALPPAGGGSDQPRSGEADPASLIDQAGRQAPRRNGRWTRSAPNSAAKP
jgi:hypothetical protein